MHSIKRKCYHLGSLTPMHKESLFSMTEWNDSILDLKKNFADDLKFFLNFYLLMSPGCSVSARQRLFI